MTTPAKHRISELTVDECFDLLAKSALGRLAYAVEGHPRILPLNFQLHEGSVVFRTGYGDMLDDVHRQHVVFEVDDGDPDTATGWSVIVHGVAEEIWRPEELEVVRQLPLQPWAAGSKDHYVRILSSMITGRRIS